MKSNVIAIIGENETKKKDEYNKIISQYSNILPIIYYADDLNNSDNLMNFLNDCNSFSLFTSINIIVLNDCEKLKSESEKAICEMLDSYNSDNILIFYGESLTDSFKKIFEEKNYIIKNFQKISIEKLPAYIEKVLNDFKIRYDDSIIELIIDYAGYDSNKVDEFLEILNKIDKSITIDPDVVRSVLFREGYNLEKDIFKFVDSLFTADYKTTLKMLLDFKKENSSLIGLNSLLFKTARKLWDYLACRDKSILGFKQYELSKFQIYSKYYNFKKLSILINGIRNSEIKSKTSDNLFSYIELEKTIMELMNT